MRIHEILIPIVQAWQFPSLALIAGIRIDEVVEVDRSQIGNAVPHVREDDMHVLIAASGTMKS